jgi:hypothetical protein
MDGVTQEIASILTTLRSLEDHMKILRKQISPQKKERKPNPWLLFNKRIATLMTENSLSFTSVGEAKKFAARLRKKKAYANWQDSELLEERTDWLMETLLTCPVCEEHIQDNVGKHKDCIVKFASNTTTQNAVSAWMCAAGVRRFPETEVVTIIEETSAPAKRGRGRGRGRPCKVIETAPEPSLPGNTE